MLKYLRDFGMGITLGLEQKIMECKTSQKQYIKLMT